MARWTVNGLVRTGARSAPGRFVLRVLRDLGSLALVDRGMTLAAHVFTSILPILIVAGAVRASLDPQSGPLIAEHLGLDEATAQILEDSLPGGAQELRVTGIVGVVLLVIAATSFARALERSLRTIWRTPAVSIKFAWRWLAALMTVIIGLALIVATRTVLVDGQSDPGDRVRSGGRAVGRAVVDRVVGRRQSTRQPARAAARIRARRARLRRRRHGRTRRPSAPARRLGQSLRRARHGVHLHRVAPGAGVRPARRSDERSGGYLTYTGRAWRRSASAPTAVHLANDGR